VDARGLFCFIGAEPATSWLTSLDRDTDGFLLTGSDIEVQSLEQWQGLGREPLPFETSTPRVFAAGDVRRGSMKRVAAAVGEGSSAVASVHRVLAG
jgi:thioredoxin reductase (NADPH)